MKRSEFISTLLALAACAAVAWGAPAKREPHIGYIFPGGGRQGSTFEVTVGGQFLKGVNYIHVTGQGVRASLVKHYRLRRNIPQEERKELVRQLRELMKKRFDELPSKGRAFSVPGVGWLGKRAGKAGKKAKDIATTQPANLPNHPLLRDLGSKSLRELLHVTNELLSWKNRKKRQPNSQLAEMVIVRVTVDRDAAPGDRELRLGTYRGLTNPMCFQIGLLPEVREQEPNHPKSYSFLPKEPPVDLPVVLNGQIMPGDIDRFRFRAKEGQRLVMKTVARRLVPYLADAVPGWFQATLALYDEKGNEVAFADDYRFHPDPVLLYKIPKDGEYELEIRDSIYRGREDFVYRIAVGQLPFITQAFPLGGRTDVSTIAAIAGWNLPAKGLYLDTQRGDDCIRQTAFCQNGSLSNGVTYAVDTLPECYEAEPNNDTKSAQRIELPRIVNGRIIRPGDVDVFQFETGAGGEVVAEVLGRRLGSPLDSLLRITDASGRVVGWNDDYMLKEGHLHRCMGLLTHHADSYLMARLPKRGTYYVHVADTQNHGGDAYGYRLRISTPRPDFELRTVPSSISVPAGHLAVVTVHALRKDGFEGDIGLRLKNAPVGFELSGGRIPSGRDCVRMTLATPRQALGQPVVLHLEGRAQIDGRKVSRPVVPAEDVMQAFLYRHLLPSQELMVAVTKARWGISGMRLTGCFPLQVPAGGSAQVRFKAPWRRWRQIKLELCEPAEGMTLQAVKPGPDGLAFDVKAEGEAAKVGFADNLIIEAFMEHMANKKGQKGAKAQKVKRRVSMGMLPAIPFVVVKP